MDHELQKKLQDAVWAARSLFERGKTSGSSANLSFLHNGVVYITASGSCFGTLTEEDFAAVTLDGTPVNDKKASKEFTLHKCYYEKDPAVQAVIHTHGPYAVQWSCRVFDTDEDVIPNYTPYLRMKVGSIALVPYAPPGTEALFSAFRAALPKGDGYLLKNHGGIIGGKSMMDAFFGIEELEESARVACAVEPNGPYEKIP